MALIAKVVFTLAVSFSLLVSLAPAGPIVPASEKDMGCCSREKESKAPQPCQDDSCVMQCCRIVPLQSESRPVLEPAEVVVPAVLASPLALHTLTEPDTIFHPPRI